MGDKPEAAGIERDRHPYATSSGTGETSQADRGYLRDEAESCFSHMHTTDLATYRWLTDWLSGKPPSNVWLGFTAEDQEHFNRRWPIVREIPAAIRFCSYEPAIGPLRLPNPIDITGDLHWLICGGESGPNRRPFEQQWEEDIRRDCEHAGIAYFFKQQGGKRPIPPDYPLVRQFPLAQEDRDAS